MMRRRQARGEVADAIGGNGGLAPKRHGPGGHSRRGQGAAPRAILIGLAIRLVPHLVDCRLLMPSSKSGQGLTSSAEPPGARIRIASAGCLRLDQRGRRDAVLGPVPPDDADLDQPGRRQGPGGMPPGMAMAVAQQGEVVRSEALPPVGAADRPRPGTREEDQEQPDRRRRSAAAAGPGARARWRTRLLASRRAASALPSPSARASPEAGPRATRSGSAGGRPPYLLKKRYAQKKENNCVRPPVVPSVLHPWSVDAPPLQRSRSTPLPPGLRRRPLEHLVVARP